MYVNLSLLIGFFGVVNAAVSLVSLRAGRYKEVLKSQNVNHLSDLLETATKDEPLIVFQFEHFKAYEKFASSNVSDYPFLAGSFYSFFSSIFNNEDLAWSKDHITRVDFSQVTAEVTSKSVQELENSGNAVLVRFTENDYALDSLDSFMSNIYVELQNIMPEVGGVVFQFPHDGKIEASDILRAKEKYESSQPETIMISAVDETPSEPSDNDTLSSIWTEGLLSCLIVSGLLLWILVLAISWLMSLNISYGALEKSTNPLKKNN